MSDEVPLTPRKELNLRILSRAGGPIALVIPTTDLPILGPSFAARVAMQFELIKRFRASFSARIGALSDQDIATHFDQLGNPVSNEGKFFALELREVLAKANETIWDEVALTPDRFRPDFTTWGARTA